jgi:hypothetical protein
VTNEGSQGNLVLVLCAPFSLALVASGRAGGEFSAKMQPYKGQIKSVKIDKCGLQPGSCEGSVILSKAGGGGEMSLAIKPGTWLKRCD